MPRKSDGQERALAFIEKYLAKRGKGPKIGVIADALKEPRRNISRWVKKLAAAGKVNYRARDFESLRLGAGKRSGGGAARAAREPVPADGTIGSAIELLVAKRNEIDAAIESLRKLEVT